MIDLTQIANCIIALICAVITAFLIPWIKSKTTKNQRDEIMDLVCVAVRAAEQIFKYHDGDEKKMYVLDVLKEHGYSVDSAEIDAMIESAVLALKQAVDE